MPLLFQHRIYRADLRANRSALYVFGDNEERVGLGGQAAEMRGEPNAIGIATLRAPGHYWNRRETMRQCAVIDKDAAPVFAALDDGRVVVFPLDGIGTGLARLKESAPATFDHLQRLLDRMRGAADTAEFLQ